MLSKYSRYKQKVIFNFFFFSWNFSNPNISERNSEAGWTCNSCTFQNKISQRNCEACTMPFLSAGKPIKITSMDYNHLLHC